jgi:hypothetical protein
MVNLHSLRSHFLTNFFPPDMFVFGHLRDTRDTRDTRDSETLSKLKMSKYELPVQEIKTATELDLSNKELNYLDAIVIAGLIQVRKIAKSNFD